MPLAAREAATAARSGDLAGHAFAANRIEFVNLIVNHPTGLGVMDVALLQEFTFTDLTPRVLTGRSYPCRWMCCWRRLLR